MAKTINSLLPATTALLEALGARLRLARLRRKLTAKQVAERAGISTMTLRSLERGTSGATIGAYVAVMQTLGIEKDLSLLAQADKAGRALQDAELISGKRRATSTGKFVTGSFILSKQPTVEKTLVVPRKIGRDAGTGTFINTKKVPEQAYPPTSSSRRDSIPQKEASRNGGVRAENLFRLLDIPPAKLQSGSKKR